MRAYQRRVLAAAIALIGASAARGQPERVIPGPAALEDARLARRAIEMIHPGLTRYTPGAELAADFDRLEGACGRDIREDEFYARLSVILARIRCSHTKAEPSEAWARWRSAAPTYLPWRFVIEDGRMIVIRSACAGLAAGDEVLSIDSVSAGEVMSRILSAVPADGWTDDSRRLALGSQSDLDESELDHFLPAFFGFGLADGRVRIEARSPGEVVSRSVEAGMMTADERRRALAEPAPAANLDESVLLEIRPGGIGILRVGTFVAYRKKITPEEVYRPHFERLAAEGVGTLILDLRENGGGSDSAAIDLARFLVGEPFSVETRQWVKTFRFGDLAARLETWDRSVLNMPEDRFRDLGNGYYELRRPDEEERRRFTPLEPNYRGRVIALCGPANASGATLFLAGLKNRRDLTLIGEPTGGSVEGPTAGVILFLPLPNSGIRVRIPALRSVTGLTSRDGTLWPDILVRTTASQRIAGEDPVMERAMEAAQPHQK